MHGTHGRREHGSFLATDRIHSDRKKDAGSGPRVKLGSWTVKERLVKQTSVGARLQRAESG